MAKRTDRDKPNAPVPRKSNILEKLDGAESASVLQALLARHPELQSEAEALGEENLPQVSQLSVANDDRALYLGWLSGVTRRNVDDGQPEPPVPAGLRNLSPALTSLAEFLDIDSDLLEVAAELSADREVSAPSSEMLAAWIAALPETEKNTLLLQVVSGENPRVGADLMRRFERECRKTVEVASPSSRTAGELYAAAELRRAENARRAEERERREQEREAQRRAAERERFPDSLEGREVQAWNHLDTLIAAKRQNDYDRAVTALTDLRDLANRQNGAAEFQERLRNLCARHTSKPSFLRKIKEASLQ